MAQASKRYPMDRAVRNLSTLTTRNSPIVSAPLVNGLNLPAAIHDQLSAADNVSHRLIKAMWPQTNGIG